MSRTYWFLRHAEAENQDPEFASGPVLRDESGRTDYPLSVRGNAQAAAAARFVKSLGAELVVTSALARAKETGATIAEACGLSTPDAWADLDEINPGRASLTELSVRSKKHAAVSAALVAAYLFDRRVSKRREGESAAAVLARIERVMARLEALPHSRVVVVSHGYWIATMAMLLGPSLRDVRYVRHVSVTTVDADGPTLRSFARPIEAL